MAKDDCFPHLSDLLSLTYALYLTRDTALIRKAVKRGIADASKERPDLAFACQGAKADLAHYSHNSLFLNSEFLNRVSSYGVAPDTLLPFILRSMRKVEPRHKKGISRALTAWNGIASKVMKRVRCKCDEQRLKDFSQQRGMVPTSRLSAEIDRLHETGLTQVLLQALWREFPDEAEEMGFPKESDAVGGKRGAPEQYDAVKDTKHYEAWKREKAAKRTTQKQYEKAHDLDAGFLKKARWRIARRWKRAGNRKPRK